MSENVVQQVFDAKWLCNAMPKHGTHLLVAMVGQIAPYQEGTEAGLFNLPWAGTFDDNSFTLRRVPLYQTTYKIGRIGNGKTIKAHLGYSPELANFMSLLGIVHIFLYRDLRDVAVSQAWHIINSTEDSLMFPDRDAYPVEDFDKVLELVIAGHDIFPGVIERWVHYAGWLKDEDTLSIRFEMLLDRPEESAELIFKYGMNYNAQKWHRKIEGYDEDGLAYLVWRMTAAGQARDRSPTFREGKSGGWKNAFTDKHVKLWKKHDKERWLERLGYEKGEWYDN